MSTFWELMAGMGFVIGDLVAVLAAVGAFSMLAVTVINVTAKRRVLTVADIFLQWAGAGTFVGTLTTIGLTVSPGYNLERIGFIIGLSYSNIAMLLVAALLMLVVSIVLRFRFLPSHSRVRP